jgi:hypothetical protein
MGRGAAVGAADATTLGWADGAATRVAPAEGGGTGGAGALAAAAGTADATGAAALTAEEDGGGAPGAKVGNLIVGAEVGLGGKLMRTVSFFGCTLAASAGLGGNAPPGGLGVFSAIFFNPASSVKLLRIAVKSQLHPPTDRFVELRGACGRQIPCRLRNG